MTPAAIAAHLDAEPIAGLTHRYGEEGYLDLSAFGIRGHHASATVYLNQDDLGGVFAVAGKLGASRLTTKEFWVRPETLRADLVEILAWSLNATHPDPAAPETRAALRSPGLYGEVLRKHLEDRRDALAAVDFPHLRPLVAALSAALKETST
jgi:hypothetical protein